MKGLRRTFLTGLFIMLPALITIYLLSVTFTWIDSILGNFLRDYLGIRLPAAGFVITIAAILVVGLVAGNVFGRKMIEIVESLFARIPVIKPVYASVSQIIAAFSAQRRNVFESVSMIEYPRKGLYAVGFVTGSGAGEVQAKTNQDVVTMFLPTTPNPTSGFLLLVPRDELIPLDMSVDEAMKLIISAGVVVPEWPRKAEEGGA